MKKSNQLIAAIAIAVIVVGAIIFSIINAAGGNLDIVTADSVRAFGDVINATPDTVEQDEAQWSIGSPDDSAHFVLSKDFSQSSIYDIMLEVDAAPFVAAGLDVNQLPQNFTAVDDTLYIGQNLESAVTASSSDASASDVYKKIAYANRSSIGYHMALDHYNVSLGDGNMFEWAKNMKIHSMTGENQDKDIVFVLNPEPLIKAGVDPEKVEGWVYTTVNVGMNGKVNNVYKFLKPIDLA